MDGANVVPWLLATITSMAAVIVSLALYAHRLEVKSWRDRAERAEDRLRAYERPAAEAARHVEHASRLAAIRRRSLPSSFEGGDPWESLHTPQAPRRRRSRS